MKTRALILALVALSPFAPNALCATSKPVICAYVFTRETPLAPGQVDGSKLTRINYAFANIEQGRIVEGAPATAGNLAVLTAMRRDNPNLTVLISVGGWLWSGRFSDMALTPASRATFIDSVAAFLSRYDLDGLDIDWEFPGQVGAGNTFRPEDKQNYTSLVKELRARFRLHREEDPPAPLSDRRRRRNHRLPRPHRDGRGPEVCRHRQPDGLRLLRTRRQPGNRQSRASVHRSC